MLFRSRTYSSRRRRRWLRWLHLSYVGFVWSLVGLHWTLGACMSRAGFELYPNRCWAWIWEASGTIVEGGCGTSMGNEGRIDDVAVCKCVQTCLFACWTCWNTQNHKRYYFIINAVSIFTNLVSFERIF